MTFLTSKVCSTPYPFYPTNGPFHAAHRVQILEDDNMRLSETLQVLLEEVNNLRSPVRTAGLRNAIRVHSSCVTRMSTPCSVSLLSSGPNMSILPSHLRNPTSNHQIHHHTKSNTISLKLVLLRQPNYRLHLCSECLHLRRVNLPSLVVIHHQLRLRRQMLFARKAPTISRASKSVWKTQLGRFYQLL